jgi:hypothetical protein
VFYKQRRLVMDVTFCSGAVASYKFVPTMAATPFLLSPVVDSGNGFARLFFGHEDLRPARVDSFVVRYGDSESPVQGWNPPFDFKTYAPQDAAAGTPSPMAVLNRN